MNNFRSRFLNILAIAALMIFSVMNAPAAVRLFIFSGQSNMLVLDIESDFVPVIKKSFPNDEIVVVKEAVKGQPIRSWDRLWTPGPNGPFVKVKRNGVVYRKLMERVNAAIENKPAIASVTFVWMHGEADTKEGGDVYEESLAALIAQLRGDLDRQDTNIVIGRLTDVLDPDRPFWATVREAQVKVVSADPKAAWVDTDDLNGPANSAQFTEEGLKILGERFAEKAIWLIKGKVQSAAAPSQSGKL